MSTAISDNVKTKIKEMQGEIPENSVDLPAKSPFWISRSVDLGKRKPVQWRIKRLIDIIASSFGLIILSPLFLLTAVSIKLESSGPVFFSQKRTGRHGKDFNMIKFRSMRQDAEEQLKELLKYNESDDITMFKLTNDPRITRIGRFIRKFSIDELPQLINVFKGDMSLIGPRPLPKREGGLENYKDWHYLRYAVLPGLSGLWQVSGRSNMKELDSIVSLDCQYIKNWNLALDIKILVKTIPAVFLSKGAV